MVKLGFIAEGATEKIILESVDFRRYLTDSKIDFVADVIDAGGNGNLLPKNIEAFTSILEAKGATHIFILTDLDDAECITHTKARIQPLPHHVIIVSVKAIEAWFLADTDAIRAYLNDPAYTQSQPETVNNPYEEIKKLRIARAGRGTVSKTVLAKKMVDTHHFSVMKAANHPECNSARYFLEKLAVTAYVK